MKTYVTFGFIHHHEIDGKVFDKDSVAVIETKTEAEGRKRAFELFGQKFASWYTEAPTDKFLSYFPRGLIDVHGEKHAHN